MIQKYLKYCKNCKKKTPHNIVKISRLKGAKIRCDECFTNNKRHYNILKLKLLEVKKNGVK